MKDLTCPSDPKPIDCAGGLIVSHGRILLGLRAPDSKTYPNVWDVFGGHVEGDETVEEALVRELDEELDIIPTRFEFIESFSEPDPRRNGKCLYHFFKVTSWSGPGPRLRGAEHTEIRWHTLDEALTLNLAAPEYRTLFKDNVA
jgi:8-oxo-dGTP pyrophosphatase MutT (NUDIX family)